MKIYFLIFSLFSALILTAQQNNPVFDQKLADSLGADEYGMKNYYFVILKTGPTKLTDTAEINTIFRGHMENIFRLEKSGKLVVAGPFGKNEDGFRGLFIIDAKSREEVLQLLDTDPAIKQNPGY